MGNAESGDAGPRLTSNISFFGDGPDDDEENDDVEESEAPFPVGVLTSTNGSSSSSSSSTTTAATTTTTAPAANVTPNSSLQSPVTLPPVDSDQQMDDVKPPMGYSTTDSSLMGREIKTEQIDKPMKSEKPREIEIGPVETGELRSLIGSVRATGEPMLDFVALVGGMTKKPVKFYAHFDQADLRALSKLAETSTWKDVMAQLYLTAESTVRRPEMRESFLQRVFMLLVVEERRRIRLKSSMAPSTLRILEALMATHDIDQPTTSNSDGMDIAAILFRDTFGQLVAAAFTEVQMKLPNSWNTVAELCQHEKAGQFFAKYLVETMRQAPAQGYTAAMMSRHYGLLDAEIINLKNCIVGSKAVASRRGTVGDGARVFSSGVNDFYGNDLRVWDTLVKECGYSMAEQYRPFVKEFSALHLVPEEKPSLY